MLAGRPHPSKSYCVLFGTSISHSILGPRIKGQLGRSISVCPCVPGEYTPNPAQGQWRCSVFPSPTKECRQHWFLELTVGWEGEVFVSGHGLPPWVAAWSQSWGILCGNIKILNQRLSVKAGGRASQLQPTQVITTATTTMPAPWQGLGMLQIGTLANLQAEQIWLHTAVLPAVG